MEQQHTPPNRDHQNQRRIAVDYNDYDSTDIGQIINDHEQAQARASRYSQKEPGDYYVRLLPPIVTAPGERKPAWREFGRHYDFGLLRGMPGTDPRDVICLHLTFRQQCLSCQVNEQLFRQAYGSDGKANTDLLDKAKQTRPAVRFVANVLPVTARNTAIEGSIPKTWEFGMPIVRQLRAIFADYRATPITHPTNGFVLCVTYAKDKYTSAKYVRHTPISGPLPYRAWAEERHDLDAYVANQAPTPEQLRDYFTPGGAAQRNLNLDARVVHDPGVDVVEGITPPGSAPTTSHPQYSQTEVLAALRDGTMTPEEAVKYLSTPS
jgi:hypothetical protein